MSQPKAIDGRTCGAFWEKNEWGAAPRKSDPTQLWFHWTAGEAGDKDPDGPGILTAYDDDGPRVVRGMKARPSTDPVKAAQGVRLQVSVHYVIGACDPLSEWATIWMTADPATTRCTHVGFRPGNDYGIAIEIVSAGLPGKLDVRKRPRITLPMRGRKMEQLLFYPGQLRSAAWLAHHLCEKFGIPKQVPKSGTSYATTNLTAQRCRSFAGALEHYHCPGTKKVDAGGQVVRHLLTQHHFGLG